MNRIRRKLFVLLVTLFIVSACTAQTTQSPPLLVEPAVTLDSELLPATEADVPRVSIEKARAALESGSAVLVDVRSPEAFESRHIAGSISVPLGQIEMDLASVALEKDQWIITYCA
jgi:hypothetical protein